MAKIPTLGTGNKLLEKFIPDRLLPAGLAARLTDTTTPEGSALTGAIAPSANAALRADRMNMEAYEHATAYGIKVLWQDMQTGLAYGVNVSTIHRSTDGGATWTPTGGTVTNADALMRTSTGTLIVTSNVTGRMHRSTDDGATFTQVKTLTDKVLGSQGLLECPDGTLLQADYGTNSATVYKLWRSTDDGVTWVDVFTPPKGPSATQIHSVVWDHVEGCAVLMVDDMVPLHYRSDDNGLTWTLIGSATERIHPNWVAPMFFSEYIAWGYDSELGGQIARMKRSDYYAGDWTAETIEQVAHVNGKAWYWTFPVRPGVWIVAMADEVIAPGWGGNPRESGSFAQEVYVVYDEGSRVAGGVTWIDPRTPFGTLSTNKFTFPGYPREYGDQKGRVWLGFIPGDGYSFSSVPCTVGWGDPLRDIMGGPPATLPVLPNGEAYRFRSADGNVRQVLTYGTNDRLSLANPRSDAKPEVRLLGTTTGAISFVFNGATLAQFVGNEMRFEPGKYIVHDGAGGPRDLAGTGSPEGVVSAPPGSTYRNRSGGAGASFYVKENGSGNTGWVAK